MREIKFRGYDQDNGVWRYGWLTQLREGARRIMAIICDDQYGDLVRYYIHDHKTIGQFTGLHDKNGAEIYEGDVINFIGFGNIPVYYDELTASFVDGSGDYLHEKTDKEACVVIGNIHEKPELIGGR